MHGGTAGGLIRDVVYADDDLTMSDLAQGSGILPGHADRGPSLLGQSCVVHHQDAVRRTVRYQGSDALLVESLGLPGSIGQEMLQAFGRGARDRSGDRVAVFPFQVREQTSKVAFHTLPTGRAAEKWREGGQVGGEFWQGIGTGFWDNRCIHKENENCTLSQRGKR